MKYDWKFFEKFLDNPEAYSNEEFLEIMPHLIEFMRKNQETFGFTDEIINDAVKQHEVFAKSYEEAKRAERELELADKKVEQSLDNFEKAAFAAMEKNGGKPIPVFLNLPKKKPNSN